MIKEYGLTYYNEIGVSSIKPHCPSKYSGVTIGCGYDLKERTEEQVVDELCGIVDCRTIFKLIKGVGLKGNSAKSFCASCNIKITKENEEDIFKILIPIYEKIAIRDFEKTFKGIKYSELPQDYKDLVFDFTYNLGTIRKFPSFFKALVNGDKKSAYNNYMRFTGGIPLGRRNKDTKKILDKLDFKSLI